MLYMTMTGRAALTCDAWWSLGPWDEQYFWCLWVRMQSQNRKMMANQSEWSSGSEWSGGLQLYSWSCRSCVRDVKDNISIDIRVSVHGSQSIWPIDTRSWSTKINVTWRILSTFVDPFRRPTLFIQYWACVDADNFEINSSVALRADLIKSPRSHSGSCMQYYFKELRKEHKCFVSVVKLQD